MLNNEIWECPEKMCASPIAPGAVWKVTAKKMLHQMNIEEGIH